MQQDHTNNIKIMLFIKYFPMQLSISITIQPMANEFDHLIHITKDHLLLTFLIHCML